MTFFGPGKMPDYQYNPGTVPAWERPQLPEKPEGIGSIIAKNLGAGLGQGVGSSLNQAMVKSELDRATGGLKPDSSPEEIVKVVSGLSPEAQDLFIKSYGMKQDLENQELANKKNALDLEHRQLVNAGLKKNLESGTPPAKAYTPQTIFSNLVKKRHIGTNGQPAEGEDATYVDDILKAGSSLLNKGVSPLDAYNGGKEYADTRKKQADVLDRKLQGVGGMFGGVFERKSTRDSSLEKDKKLVDQLRKRKDRVLTDEEIAKKLEEKGYTEEEIEKEFGLLSGTPVKTKELTLQIAKKFLEKANGDRELAKQLASSEGYNVEEVE